MQFVLMVYLPKEPPEDAAAQDAAYAAYTRALVDAGVLRGGEELAGFETASVVTVARGNVVVHDGPYADTKEQLGGFFVIEVADAAEAVRWAARCPAASEGKVEVRPTMPGPG